METLLDHPPQFQFDEFEEVATQPFQGKVAPLADAPRKLDQLEIWESESTQPTHIGGEGGSSISLTSALNNYLPRCLAHPYLPRAVIEQQKLARIQYLVALAYEEIPVYRDKYKSAGFSPSDLRTIDDIQHIPVITKQELVAAFPDCCLTRATVRTNCSTRALPAAPVRRCSFEVDLDAIVTDTIQGVRQFMLQSGGAYGRKTCSLTFIPCPGGSPRSTAPIRRRSSPTYCPAKRVAAHLAEMRPEILSCYPSNLEALVDHADVFNAQLRLAVTHSEHSTKQARAQWSKKLGAPVLDEYSSEEATRIALEMPCGHYHVCEDTVHLDVLDPLTLRPQTPGGTGVAVITNLLNEAMPFIRYVQGDCIVEPAVPEPCAINWKQIESIGGRANDAFINQFGATCRPAAFSISPTGGCSTATYT